MNVLQVFSASSKVICVEIGREGREGGEGRDRKSVSKRKDEMDQLRKVTKKFSALYRNFSLLFGHFALF